jgi:hypothetical protein
VIKEPIMRRQITLTVVLSVVLASSLLAGKNTDYRFAVHLLPHEARACSSNIPEITDCTQIETTYEGCDDFDAVVIFYQLAEVSRIEYGLQWPASWGSCIYTACAGDNVIGDIVSPGDGMIHEWDTCQTTWSVVAGYAWFGAPAEPGIIVPTVSPVSGLFGATDCDGSRDLAIGIASSGVCGLPGDDACTCGCFSEPRTWSEIKALF